MPKRNFLAVLETAAHRQNVSAKVAPSRLDQLLFGHTFNNKLVPIMTSQSETVDHATLQRMHAAGVVTDTTLVAEPGGWACIIQVRQTQYPLAAKRGGVRHWSRMDSAARYLNRLGITRFHVDARQLDVAVSGKVTRPDARAKLKRAHEAAAYDAWFREQVQAAIDEADSPDAVWYSHEEVEAEFAERRAQTRQRLANQT